MNEKICCPKFNSEPWEEKEIKWENEKFVKDRVMCFLHIPINFGSKMVKNVKLLESIGAIPVESEFVVLSGNCSLWGMDLYLKTTKEVPDAEMATISGTFLSKVFEGPYKNMRNWIDKMKEFIKSKGKESKNMYFYYTTCPKCAKAYGKNYTVILAQV